MNSVQNSTSVNFKANISKPLQEELLKELKQNVGQKYLSRLSRRLENIPANCTIQDIVHTNNGTSFVRLNYSGESKTFEISSNGNNIDIIEGLLHKEKYGTSRLSEYAYRLFGI